MKKKRITYGIFGMMEYQALIKVGKASMRICFTDGSITAMGSSPATFSTSSILTQKAIEHSGEYRRGLIKKVREITLDEEERIGLNAASPYKALSAAPVTRETAEREETEEGLSPACDAVPVEESPGKSAESDSAPEEETVAVQSLADARALLVDRYGYKESMVYTRVQINKAAAEHHITFTGI